MLQRYRAASHALRGAVGLKIQMREFQADEYRDFYGGLLNTHPFLLSHIDSALVPPHQSVSPSRAWFLGILWRVG